LKTRIKQSANEIHAKQEKSIKVRSYSFNVFKNNFQFHKISLLAH